MKAKKVGYSSICLGITLAFALQVMGGEDLIPLTGGGVITIRESGRYKLDEDASGIVCSNKNTAIEVFLDLNGHSLSGTGRLVENGKNSTLTITNSSSASAILTGTGGLTAIPGKGIYNEFASSVLFIGGKIRIENLKSKRNGAGIYNKGYLEIGDGVVISNCITEVSATGSDGNGFGGALFNSSTTIVHNCEIVDCHARSLREVPVSGSGAYDDFSKAGSAYCVGGGGIFNKPGAWMCISNVTITSCSARNTNGDNAKPYHCGGAIFNKGVMEIHAGTFGREGEGNQASYRAGGIYNDGLGNASRHVATLTMYGGVVQFNGMPNYPRFGGGLDNQYDGIMTLRGNTQVIGNQALGGAGLSGGDGQTMYLLEDTLICSNKVTNASASSLQGGGGICVGLSEKNYLVISNNCRICFNYSNTYGGGIYMRGSSGSGGAKGSGEIQMSSGMIFDNFAGMDGGGIYTQGAVTIDGGSISNNLAKECGGGVYITNTDNQKFNMSHGAIVDNLAFEDGGGVYVDKAPVSLKGGFVEGNVATNNGGGLYIASSTIAVQGAMDIEKNTAVTGNGGGVYVSGGSLTLEGGLVADNAAGASGGGFYVDKATLNLNKGDDSAGVTVAKNACDGDGAGLAVLCATSKSVTLNGGMVEQNVAKGNGGGFWISGKGTETSKITGDIEVYGNEAKNGGGFYLDSKACFNVEGGFVYGNKAVGDPAATFSTAYKGGNGSGTPEGVGGGFYLAQGASTSKTTLRFNLAAGQAIGVFANKADCAADDVAAEGSYAEIQNMPAVEEMVLDKLAGAVVTGWDEDYRTNDTCYSEGTIELGRDFKNAERYRTVIARGDDPIEASTLVTGAGKKETRYLCLTLGYNFPIPEYLWITDHEDLGNGVVNLQFRPCFSNENDKTFSIVQWAKAADEGGNLWVVWGESEQELLANCDDIKDGTNGMCVALREYEPIDNDTKRIWVTTPFFTNWTHEASSGTNRFYKIVVEDLRENILKDKNQASK